MSRCRIASLIVSLVAVATLAACSGDADPAENDAAETDPATSAPSVEDPAAPAESEAPELVTPELVDGAVRDLGLIVPIPVGWMVDAQAYADGVVVSGPQGAPGSATIVAASGVQDNPMLGLQGVSFDDAIEALRGTQSNGTLAIDEEISFAGAERAWMLQFTDVVGQQGMPATDQLVLLAVDADADIALFNYSSVAGEYDAEIEALLLEGGGLDPDSEPVVPQVPDAQPAP